MFRNGIFQKLHWKIFGAGSILALVLSTGALTFFCRSEGLTGGDTRCSPEWLDAIGAPVLLVIVVISGITTAAIVYQITEFPPSFPQAGEGEPPDRGSPKS